MSGGSISIHRRTSDGSKSVHHCKFVTPSVTLHLSTFCIAADSPCKLQLYTRTYKWICKPWIGHFRHQLEHLKLGLLSNGREPCFLYPVIVVGMLRVGAMEIAYAEAEEVCP
uniref:Uncharacterized protein n=1 Tax=Cucumis melo TaxID=3656 RepID=A0A9I9EID9_CUCME